MKTYLEKLPGLLAFIESGNGFAKKKAKKELEEMAILADKNIKLPSDDEIETKCWKDLYEDSDYLSIDDDRIYGAIDGAKWMRNLLINK